jgi:hypothetical protein
MVAHACFEWARMLRIRRDGDDQERACELLKRAEATARDFGLPNIQELARTLLYDDCRATGRL